MVDSHNGHAVHQVVAVDVVLFTIEGPTLKVLLVRRDQPPFEGKWALPGGRIRQDESVDSAALRVFQEKTGIHTIYLEQLYTFGDVQRDPRERVITVAYYALVRADKPELRQLAQDSAEWFAVKKLPPLAFDHQRIVDAALERLRHKVNYTTVGFQLLPEAFTLTELQRSYEVILAKKLDKRNFRKKMLQLGILESTEDFKASGRQRPARLYTFTRPNVITLREKGIVVPF